MSEIWSLPGYDVQELLGFGASGEVWRAVAVATGEVVALKRLRAGADPVAVEALRRGVALLRALDTPYVVRLREVVGAGADIVLVLDHAAGGSLAMLLARRGALEPGEVVTVAVPLAQALAAAHSRGLVHGDVTPSNVLFTADGMPLLSDLGLARVAGERLTSVDGTGYVDPAVARGGDPDAAADVWALAAVCHHMLAGSPPHVGADVPEVLTAASAGQRAPLGLLAPDAPRALVAAVEAGLAPDASDRPDAAAFASLLRRAHAAAPVRLTDGVTPAGPVAAVRPTHQVRPAAEPAAGAARRRRLPQGVLLGAALVALLVVGAVLGWASGRGGEQLARPLPPPPSPSLAAAVPAPDWSALLDDLDAQRAQAFADGDVARLSRAFAPGSAGLALDTGRLQSLVDRGQSAHGLRHTVQSTDVLEAGDDRARLRVVDVLLPYELRDRSGAVLERVPGRAASPFLAELVRTPEGWRLVEVRPEG